MREIIKKILNEQFDQFQDGIPKLIVSYFKFLNRSKTKNVKELKELMKETLPMIQKSKDDLPLYYQLYKANYRKDGRYDLIGKEDFIGPSELPARTIQNNQSGPFVKNKVPFKGSNLEGYWEKDLNGVSQYVVLSYRWYPIYLFKEDQWYAVDESYSSSTGRQIHHANPIEHLNKDLGLKMLVLTKKEMQSVRRTLLKDEIIKLKKQSLVQAKPELSKRLKSTSFYLGNWYDKMKIKFRIKDAILNENKVSLVVKVEDVVGTYTGPEKQSNEFEMNDHNKKIIEKGIYNYIISKYQGLVGSKQYKYTDVDGEDIFDYNLPENLIFNMSFEY